MSFRRRNTYVCEAKCVDIMKFINPEYDDTKRCSNDVATEMFDAVVRYVYIQDELMIKKRSYKVRVTSDKFHRDMYDHIVRTKKNFDFLDFKWKLIGSLRSSGDVDPFGFKFEKRNLDDTKKSSLRWFARFCHKIFKETEYDYLFEDMLLYVSYFGLMTKDFRPCDLPDCKYVGLEMEDAILFVNYENEFSFIKLMLMYFSLYYISNGNIILRDGLLFDFEKVYDYIFVASADDYDMPELDDVEIVHKTVLSGHDDVN